MYLAKSAAMYYTRLHWRRMMFIYALSNVLFYTSGANDSEERKDGCQTSFLKARESFLLPSINCEKHIYVISCLNASSVVSISTQLESLGSRSYAETQQVSKDSRIVVAFMENKVHEDGSNSLITTHGWTITPETVRDEHHYISRTSRLQMSLEVAGDWADNLVTFLSKELDFNMYNKSFDDASEVIKPWQFIRGRNYKPNSVFLAQINADKAKSIDLNLKKLDIDVSVGEYLLIGSGVNPFEGPPPLFVARRHQKNYKIFDSNAYIVFVSTFSRSDYEGFEITWTHDGATSPDEDSKDHVRRDDVLQSVQVCIYNKSAAFAEFNKTDSFKLFREKVSEIASTYAKENNPLSQYSSIEWTQVEIFRVSDIIREDPDVEILRSGGLYVMVKIQGAEIGAAAFRRSELECIIETYYKGNHSTNLNGYKIESCPSVRRPNLKNNIVFYAVIPMLCCFFLIIWAWRHSRLSKIFVKKRKSSAIRVVRPKRISEVHAENEYTNSAVPKVLITEEHGRSYTFSQEEMTSDSEVEVFNLNHFPRGNTNEAFVEDEGSSPLHQAAQSLETGSNETEHYYDTVQSCRNKRNEDETKL